MPRAHAQPSHVWHEFQNATNHQTLHRSFGLSAEDLDDQGDTGGNRCLLGKAQKLDQQGSPEAIR